MTSLDLTTGTLAYVTPEQALGGEALQNTGEEEETVLPEEDITAEEELGTGEEMPSEEELSGDGEENMQEAAGEEGIDPATQRLLDRVQNREGQVGSEQTFYTGAPLQESVNPSPLAPTGPATIMVIAIAGIALVWTLYRASRAQKRA